MLFNSSAFLAFFPLVVVFYFLLNHRQSIYWLLFTSCIFYMWLVPNYLIILILTVIVDYFGGLFIEQSQGKLKKFFLIFSIITTCLILFVFKYFNFYQTNVLTIAKFLDWNYDPQVINLLLPVGLSFHTFQSLSYVFEVYKNKQKAEKDFVVYFLYVMFFPQLVAGPIERPQHLLHQFHAKHEFNYFRIVSGLKLIIIGLFKKVVIADRLSMLVNPTFNSWQTAPAPILLLSVFFFAFQIYCDFSGYSTIARGTARVLGFELMENFNRPYLSRTVTEFWQRWHISLSSWFRDYFYITIGGNKKRVSLNVLLTFLVSGLWHGANWTYVCWGGLNGLAILIEKKLGLGKSQSKDLLNLKSLAQISITFVAICFTWIFFRASSVTEALNIITNISLAEWSNSDAFLIKTGFRNFDLILGLTLIFILIIYEFYEETKNYIIESKYLYLILTLSIILFGVFNQNQFIYFQF